MNVPHPPSNEPTASQFLPLHKLALGVAFGVAAAIVVFAATATIILRDPPEPHVDLGLLAQYFAGYSVSWRGAFIGAGWAAFTGFVVGWFFAFCRNVTLALMVLFVRARAELVQSRDFLDQI